MTIPLTETFGTAQTPDRLIYKGDTLWIFSNPLEQLNGIDSLRKILFGDQEGCMSTACWRGYEAEWTIMNNELYLVGIYSCCFYEDSIKADLRKLFGKKLVDGKVRAEWVSGEILSPQGKLLSYVHMGYRSIYEKEQVFLFKDGKLIEIKTYDNSKSKQSDFSKNPDKLQEFIYSNINWTLIPRKEQPVKIYVQFSANEYGEVDSVKIMKGRDGVFNQKAERVIKKIPEWDVYYRHGEFERKSWTMPIIFNEENRKKYKK